MALASGARYLFRGILCCCHQGQHWRGKQTLAHKLPSFYYGDEYLRASGGCFKKPDWVWMFKGGSLKNATVHGNSLQGSWAQSGNESGTSKTKMYVFIWNPPELSKKLCQLQIEPAFLSYALGNQSIFAYTHQNHFQNTPPPQFSSVSHKIPPTALHCIIKELKEGSCSVYCAC